MEMILYRAAYFLPSFATQPGTFGLLVLPDGDTFATVEREWNGNQPFISCVPEGTYELLPAKSPRWGKTFLLHNPGLRVFPTAPSTEHEGDRWACLFHPANWPHELSGCIAVGEEATLVRGKLGVSYSQLNTERLLEKLFNAERPHTLRVERLSSSTKLEAIQ